MDLATLIGIIAGLGVVGAAIFLGGDFGAFIDVPSLLIVGGGTTAATFIKFPMSDVFSSLKRGVAIAFKNSRSDLRYLYDQAIEIAGVVRKDGLLGLESVEVENELMQRGLRLCVDGHKLEVVRDTISREVDLSIQRDEAGELMFRGIGDSAPAFGMIGTLVGLVQMLSALDDPASIGPAMAIAMLTTFYGALLANLIALPIADKLAWKVEQDRKAKNLIVQSVLEIHGGQNPSVLAELLSVYLPGGAAEAAAAEE
ncbi:MAG: MotA/TolQ/ExbB proton channel family protein [Magnetospiraceae bacterium]